MSTCREDLINFEQEISDLYCDAKIKAPVHLSDGNEEQLIEVFKQIDKEDWVFSTWRSHYHALLHGIDPKWVKKEIVDGNSITLNNSQHRFFASAIVGGILPIAVGTALALKMKKSKKKVWAFVGDMTAETGGFHETVKYSQNHNLPITFIIEDNGYSVGTPTKKTWGKKETTIQNLPLKKIEDKVYKYEYIKGKWPHVGAGKWVTF